jgi:hypothetical protein
LINIYNVIDIVFLIFKQKSRFMAYSVGNFPGKSDGQKKKDDEKKKKICGKIQNFVDRNFNKTSANSVVLMNGLLRKN